MGPCNHLGRPYCVLAVAAASTPELYNRHFTLLDLRYPGKNGHIVRTLHNPFGNGRNVIFIGGSDVDFVEAATRQFIRRLNEADAASGQLTHWYLTYMEGCLDYSPMERVAGAIEERRHPDTTRQPGDPVHRRLLS